MISLQTLPDPETIRRTAQEVVRRPEYSPDAGPVDAPFLWEILMRALYWLLKPFRWLFDAMDGIPDVLRWLIVIGLAVLLVVLIGHILYTIVAALQGRARTSTFQSVDADRRPDPAALEQLAQQAVSRGDFITAVRNLFRACLLRLESRFQRRFQPGLTNREYLRRFRASGFAQPLALFVDTIDSKWYGGAVCGRQDYEMCRQAYEDILEELRGAVDADRA